MITRCTRSRAPSLVSRCPTWVFAVASLMYSRAAISELDMPVAISARTSRSRAVMPARAGLAGFPAGGGAGGPPRRRAAGELRYQTAGDARGQQGIAVRDDPDRGEQLARLGALEQEPAGPGVQRRE